MPAMGLATTAVALGRMVEDPGNEPETLRLIIQASDDFGLLTDDASRWAFLAEPPLTGDVRLDAMLAGLAVHLCRLAGMHRTPAWTRKPDRYLDRFWWFGLEDTSTLRAYVYQRTPSCMRARGVLFNAEELESV